MIDVCATLTGLRAPSRAVEIRAERVAPPDYLALRRSVFVEDYRLFARDDRDDHDVDPATVHLLARTPDGELLGGVRVHRGDGPADGWWRGGRLVVRRGAPAGTGSALVRAATATAEGLGAVRFDAEVLAARRGFFERLGWAVLRPVRAHGRPHLLMHVPTGRFADLVAATKAPLAPLLGAFRGGPGGLGGAGFVGDDAAPVGRGIVASVDAITPSMVERDPDWAGWCGVLVGANDLAAMGAQGNGLLDALGSPTAAHAARVLRGLRAAADAYGLPVLGGHTQLGVPAALSVTALGVTDAPVPGGGGRVGDVVHLTADVGGGWRPGYSGRQWDSTSWRRAADLAAMTSMVQRSAPHAAKDVSMAGIIGTVGMLAEAGGTGVELDVAAVPRPAGAGLADWLTCFPGFGMLTADAPDRAPAPAGPAVAAACGRLTAAPGVRLRWPDGVTTTALAGGVTGLGRAG